MAPLQSGDPNLHSTSLNPSTRDSSEKVSVDSSSTRHLQHANDRSGSRPCDATPKRGWWKNRTRLVIILAVIMIGLALALGLGLGLGLKKTKAQCTNCLPQTERPNVLVIMTDDQDKRLDSMNVMPLVEQLIGDQGVRYENHYCTTAWCCPSRVNFLTGKAPHNTNVTSTTPPYGGWPKFSKNGLNENYLPVWISDAGINTYYVGKFMNGYSIENLQKPEYPMGWTDSTFLLDPFTYDYYNSTWTEEDNLQPVQYPGIHTTNVTEAKALDMLDEAAYSGSQFFMMVAPVAPHQQLTPHGGLSAPPPPAEWEGVFEDRQVPKSANFNPVERSGASWVWNAERLTAGELRVCNHTFVNRLANIAAVDVMVSNIIARLDQHGILDNTFVIFTSDNGFHIGNHRLLPGKRCPYEEDVNIPLLIRGPGMPKGVNSTITNSHTDMAPTILQMLGIGSRDDFDGSPIAYTSAAIAESNKTEIVTVEFWNADGQTPIGLKKHNYYNNTYKAIRFNDGQNSFYYSKWCTGEREFHDMTNDVAQMDNLLGNPPRGDTSTLYYGRPLTQLIDRLDALLMVTKSCLGDSCREPWKSLFLDGQVSTLEQAMTSQYDAFFDAQPLVAFEHCTPGYFPEMELPLLFNVFGNWSGT